MFVLNPGGRGGGSGKSGPNQAFWQNAYFFGWLGAYFALVRGAYVFFSSRSAKAIKE